MKLTKNQMIIAVFVVVLFVGVFLFVTRNKTDKGSEEAPGGETAPVTPPSGGNCSQPFTQAAGSTRGLRNNNPGNIVLTNIDWVGKVPNNCNTDGEFEQFYRKIHGVRALIRNLRTYYYTHNLKTIRGIINRWSATDKAAYIAFVSQKMGKTPDQPLIWNKTTIGNLVKAIAHFENGTSNAVTQMEFEDAFHLLYPNHGNAQGPTIGGTPFSGGYTGFYVLR